MDVYEAVKKRKSVRSFLAKEIPEDLLTKILDAARFAPSANNRQEWRFIVVRDRKTKTELAQIAGQQDFVADASAVLVCCGVDEGKVMHCGQQAYPIDVTIAIDHITLLAAAEGLGTCWIGHFDEPAVKSLLDIPDNVRVVELLPIGYPTDPNLKTKSRLPLSAVLRYEKWR